MVTRAARGAALKVSAVFFIFSGLWVEPASARPELLGTWESMYGSSDSAVNAAGAGSKCQLCHENSSGGTPWNGYGWAIKAALAADASGDDVSALRSVESQNSDADASLSLNLNEIEGNSQPGWTLGPNNTIYNKNGTVQTNQPPPAGILGEIDIDPPVDAVINIVPAELAFDSVLINATAQADLVLTNLGQATLTVTNVSLCGGTSSEFGIPAWSQAAIEFGQSVTVPVDYSPSATGLDTGCLEVSSDDPVDGSVQVPLSGFGVETLVDVDITQFLTADSADLDNGDTVTPSVDIINSGKGRNSVLVHVIAEQAGTELYSETQEVDSGRRRTRQSVSFPSYVPDRVGMITWTAEVIDGDPDRDAATSSTDVFSSLIGRRLDDPIPGSIQAGRVEVALEPVATGLVSPNYGIWAPGRPNDLFVVDQDGKVWVLDLAASPVERSLFHDVGALMVPLGIFGPGTYDERGLLGMAFHPDFADNGLFYLFSSEPVGSGAADFSSMPAETVADHLSVITEWRVLDPAAPSMTVDAGSRRVLLRVDQPQLNHNGGSLAFGPDGLLYIALGDGGAADDQDGQPFIGGPAVGHGPNGNGQDISTPLGAILRVDPEGNNSANGAYGIPADNPLVGVSGAVEEIYAWGFRNAFRFAFDAVTGELWTADVGQNDIEEIDVVVRGGNYGWRLLEGSFVFEPNGTGAGYVTDRDPASLPGNFVAPIAEYDHDEGISIIGGFVYRGSNSRELEGSYVFGDWSTSFDFSNPEGQIFYLDGRQNPVAFKLKDRDQVGEFVNGFGEDAGGELYLMTNSTGTPFGDSGAVYRIAPVAKGGRR